MLRCVAAAPMSTAELRAASLTWESVELEWTPGHDGGRPQVFVVTVTADDERHLPVKLTTNSSTYNVTGTVVGFSVVLVFVCELRKT